MRISDWSSGVCSSDLGKIAQGSCQYLPADYPAAGDESRSSRSNAAPMKDRRSLADTGRRWQDHSVQRAIAGFIARDRRFQRHQLADPLSHRHRSEEHTSELQSLMRITYAVFCLKKKTQKESTSE